MVLRRGIKLSQVKSSQVTTKPTGRASVRRSESEIWFIITLLVHHRTSLLTLVSMSCLTTHLIIGSTFYTPAL